MTHWASEEVPGSLTNSDCSRDFSGEHSPPDHARDIISTRVSLLHRARNLLRTNRGDGIRYLEASAALGEWRAAELLAIEAETVEGKERWSELASDYLRKAVDGGDPNAKARLATLLAYTDPSRSLELARSAAAEGIAPAMGVLANLLATSSPEEALRWEERGVELGERNSLYARGMRLARTSDPQAKYWLQEAANKTHIPAMEALGFEYERVGDTPKAIKWYRDAADLGMVSAMSRVGSLLVRSDMTEGLVWLERAAERGDSDAMFRLAIAYEEKDKKQARSWLEKACASGNTAACERLKVV